MEELTAEDIINIEALEQNNRHIFFIYELMQKNRFRYNLPFITKLNELLNEEQGLLTKLVTSQSKIKAVLDYISLDGDNILGIELGVYVEPIKASIRRMRNNLSICYIDKVLEDLKGKERIDEIDDLTQKISMLTFLYNQALLKDQMLLTATIFDRISQNTLSEFDASWAKLCMLYSFPDLENYGLKHGLEINPNPILNSLSFTSFIPKYFVDIVKSQALLPSLASSIKTIIKKDDSLFDNSFVHTALLIIIANLRAGLVLIDKDDAKEFINKANEIIEEEQNNDNKHKILSLVRTAINSRNEDITIPSYVTFNRS